MSAPDPDVAAVPTRRWAHIANWFVFAIGVAAFGWLVYDVGPARVVEQLSAIRWAWFLLIASSLASSALNAMSLHVFLGDARHRVGFLRVLIVQLSGEAINTLTPGGALGEPTKITMLTNHTGRDAALGAVTLYNLAGLVAWILLVVGGLAITLLHGGVPTELAMPIGVAFGVLVLIAVAAFSLIRYGAVGSVVRALFRMRIISEARNDKWCQVVGTIDRQLHMFRHRRHGWLGLVFVVLSRAWGQLDIVLVAASLGTLLGVHTVMVASVVDTLVSPFVQLAPMGIGLAEGETAQVFAMLGVSTALGLAVALTRRFRGLLVAALGLLCMLVSQAWRAPHTPS